MIEKLFPIINDYSKIQHDTEGLWSITLPGDANIISKIIFNTLNSNDIVIFDGTAGLGGNTISFSKHFRNVISVELDPSRFNFLKNNLALYNSNNILLINDDCTNHLNLNCDTYFFDPPWGGPDYKNYLKIKLKVGKFTLDTLIAYIKNIRNVPLFFKLPNNYDLDEFRNYNYRINKIKNYILVTIY